MSKLIISEKTDAAARIAVILSHGTSKRTSINKVPVFQFESDEGEVAIVGLRGHIIELDYPETMNRWSEVKLGDLIQTEPEKRVTANNIIDVLRTFAESIGRGGHSDRLR